VKLLRHGEYPTCLNNLINLHRKVAGNGRDDIIKDMKIKVYYVESQSEVDKVKLNFDLETNVLKDVDHSIKHIQRHYYVAYGRASKERVDQNNYVHVDQDNYYIIVFTELK